MNTPSKNDNKKIQTRHDSDDHGHVVSRQLSAVVQTYSGPIPRADELMKYEKVLPGTADRLITMAEEQAKHRRSIEKEMLSANIKSERIGQILGFLVFGVAIAVSVVLVCMGKDVAGVAVLIGEIAVLVGVFVYSREGMKRELSSEDEDEDEDEGEKNRKRL